MSNLRTIKIRGDSTENWEQANPILEYKEIACEFTGSGTLFKVGNGTDSWNDLAYTSVDGGVEEAPIDGKQYTRKDSTWVEVVVQENAVTSVSGKTGAVTLAKEDVGLSNVDNTSDINKPISNPTQDALDNKVDKVTGKGLSTNDYSNADKAKLASLEGSHFRGVYVNEAALATIQNPVAGDYADVDAGIEADAERWIYDASDSKWVSQESAASVTAAQVKQLYESNTDTNAFTNIEKNKLDGIASEATKNRADTLNADKEHTHTITQVTGLDSALSGKVDKETGKGLIEPAPIDGKQYARKDGGWEEVAAGGGGDVEEAPIDGKTYVRSDGAWAEIDYIAPVTKDFLGVDPDDNGQWVPTYLDFPDTSKTYQGSLEYKSALGTSSQYTATYLPAFGAWLVDIIPSLDLPFQMGYLTSAEMQGLLTANISFSVTSGLPVGLSSFAGDGTFDLRNALGLPPLPVAAPFEFRVSIAAGYADVLLETPLYSEEDVPLELEPEMFKDIADKLGDNLGGIPDTLFRLLSNSKSYFYGFAKGAKYWEFNREYGRIAPEYTLDAYKVTVKSANNDSQTIRFPYESEY